MSESLTFNLQIFTTNPYFFFFRDLYKIKLLSLCTQNFLILHLKSEPDCKFLHQFSSEMHVTWSVDLSWCRHCKWKYYKLKFLMWAGVNFKFGRKGSILLFHSVFYWNWKK